MKNLCGATAGTAGNFVAMAKFYWETHEANDPDGSTEYLLALTMDSLLSYGFQNFDVTDIVEAIAEPIEKA